jgi:hypothetical protein
MKLSLHSPARVIGGGYFMIDTVTRKVVGDSWFRTEATAVKHWRKNYKGTQPNVMVLSKASAFDFMVEQGCRCVI